MLLPCACVAVVWAAGMMLAISTAPLKTERRDKSVSGTRAVVSSQQAIGSPVLQPWSRLCVGCERLRQLLHSRRERSTTAPSTAVHLFSRRHYVEQKPSRPYAAA